MKVQGDLTKQNVVLVALREGTNTADDSPGAKLFRRMVLVRGAYLVESTSERIKTGLERVRVEERRPGQPSTLTPEQLRECPWIGSIPVRGRIVR